MKKVLIYLCIIIIVIIILRFLYLRLKNHYVNYMNSNSNNIENFDVNFQPGDAVDLLSKTKSNLIITSNSSNFGLATIIKPWTTKLYNIENNKTKAISLYQPNLFINNSQYCKLGDIISTSSDYSPPNSNELSLFIKKTTSDIKPPVSYNLIVNFGDEKIESKYYQYESYITNINTMNLIAPNLLYMSKVFTTMNSIIVNNYDILYENVATSIINVSNITITADSTIKYVRDLLNNSIIFGIDNASPLAPNLTTPTCAATCPGGIGKKSSFTDTSNCPLTCGFTSSIIFPAGVSGYFTTNTNSVIQFQIPGSIDNGQSQDKTKILSAISNNPFTNLTTNNINITTYNYNLFKLIPFMNIINFLSEVCDTINTIYINENTNIVFLQHLNLVSDIDVIKNILEAITEFKTFISTSPSSYNTTNLSIMSMYSNSELIPYFNTIMNKIPVKSTTVIGLIFDILKNMEITYSLSNVAFDTANIIMPEAFTDIKNSGVTRGGTRSKNNTIEHFYSFWDDVGDAFVEFGNDTDDAFKTAFDPVGCYLSGGKAGCNDSDDDGGGEVVVPIIPPGIIKITLDKYDNDFLNNVPKAKYNINLVYITDIKATIANISEFVKFQTNLSKNNVPDLPLKIYEPVAPKGYVALGHIFCNLQSQLTEIQSNDKIGKGLCCVPENCVKQIRNWNASDKVFEYNQDNIYWAIYFNPYIGTFTSTNVNQLPNGMVSKVIACVKKCTAVDELRNADKCARSYYDINKSIKSEVNVGTDLVSDQEEVFYLEKLKTQSDSITRLSNKAQQLQLAIDKATIVNSEMNKNKLQTYVDEQKTNIEIILKRLIKDKDSIQTNINIPIDVLNKILNMIKNLNISQAEKNKLLSELLNNKQLNCPGYDLTGLVKKQMVSDVCYGCDNP
jgi:hypothetical protein